MGALFWFLVAAVFIILWVVKVSSSKQSADESYKKGYAEGYWNLADAIRDELKKARPDKKKLAMYLDKPNQEPAVTEETATTHEELVSDSPTLEAAARGQSQPVLVTEALPISRPVSKKPNTHAGLNIILYVASFLLVAAVAAFVATSMPAGIRLTGILVVIALFYGAGMLLYFKVPLLRPAAGAFIGTGLAIVPFAGFALHLLGGLPEAVAWAMISIVGVALYLGATYALKNQVAAYLTVAFTLSFAASTIGVFSGPMVLYFTVLIAISLLFNLLTALKVKWVPPIFAGSLKITGYIITPIALFGSLIAFPHMTAVSYQIVFFVAAAHYAVLWLQDKKILNETLSRILTHTGLVILGAELTSSAAAFAAWWLALLVLQSVYSIVRVRLSNRESVITEVTWLSIAMGFIGFSWIIWAPSDHFALGATLHATLLVLISSAAALRVRNILLAVPALIATLALPFLVGRWLAEPHWDYSGVVAVFVASALATLAVYTVIRKGRSVAVAGFLHTAFWAYTLFALISTIFDFSAVRFITAGIILVAAIAVYSYAARRSWPIALAAWLFWIVAGVFIGESEVPYEWRPTITALVAGGVLASVATLFHAKKDVLRRNIVLVAGLVVSLGVLVSAFSVNPAVQQLSVGIIAVLAFAALWIRTRVENKFLKGTALGAYALYAAGAWAIGAQLDDAWQVAAFLVPAIVFWIGSYLEKQPWLIIFGNLALVGVISAIWGALGLPVTWQFTATALIAAVILYVAYWAVDNKGDSIRRLILIISVWTLGGMVVLGNLWADEPQRYAAAATLIALAGTLAAHGYILKKRAVIESALYVAVLGLQWIISLLAPSLTIVFYGHLWAIALAAAAYWRRHETGFQARLIIAASFVTLSSGIVALTEGGGYQLLFLVEMAALLVAGALLRKSWAIWWGVAGTVIGVLYFLKSSLFLSLMFLGLTLIAIVVWRLIRLGRK